MSEEYTPGDNQGRGPYYDEPRIERDNKRIRENLSTDEINRIRREQREQIGNTLNR